MKFKYSGGAAALFLGEKLFVQSHNRALDEADAGILLAVAPPRGRSDVSEPVEPDIAALRAPSILLADASRPDDGRPLLNDDGLYEPDWVAEYLGIARGTLDNWVSQNKVPHTHVGGKLRFVGKALREWLGSRTDWPDAEDDEVDEEDGFIDKFPWDGKT